MQGFQSRAGHVGAAIQEPGFSQGALHFQITRKSGQPGGCNLPHKSEMLCGFGGLYQPEKCPATNSTVIDLIPFGC